MRLFASNSSTSVQSLNYSERIMDGSQSDSPEPEKSPLPPEFVVRSSTSNRVLQQRKKTSRGIKEPLRIFCFQNLTSSFILVVIVLFFKIAMSVLYVVRVALEDLNTCTYCGNSSVVNEGEINWQAIIWVQKDIVIWAIEFTISMFTLTRMLIVTYVRFKGSCYKVFTLNLCLEMAVSCPFLITLLHEDYRHFYIPTFLNCWMAKRMLEQNVLSHRKMFLLSLFTHKVVEVTTTITCLIFTGLCGVQHIQRGSLGEDSKLDLFQAFYFVMVTFSTVGYGDYSPDIWPSQLLVVVLIVLAIVVLPKEFESLASTWMERQRMGGSYGGGRGGGGHASEMKHVVFCSSFITDELLGDFLNEFFSHRHLQDYYVVFMSTSEPDQAARRILRSPLWLHRVMFIRGSLLRDTDLARAGMKYAKACFLMGNDSESSKSEADQKTIIRSWSLRDYAPNVPLYVQVYRPESGVHLKFAKFAVCEEEFKFAMLAYNCLVPGTSTMLSLLLHSSTGEEGTDSTEPWLKLYGQHSGNELYRIPLSDSVIFCDCAGAYFTVAALYGHKNFGVILIGVQTSDSTDSIILNPGFNHVLKSTDMLFYLSIDREEEMDFGRCRRVSSGTVWPSTPPMMHDADVDLKHAALQQQLESKQNPESMSDAAANAESKFSANGASSSRPPDENLHAEQSSARWILETERCDLRIGILPVVPYVGIPKILCHLRREKKDNCCLSLDEACKHCSDANVKQYVWANRAIILVAEAANCGFFNFIMPLRVAHHPRKHLRPIVIILEKRPDDNFLDALSWFPLVYWMCGKLNELDSLLIGGVNFADDVVVLAREDDQGSGDRDISDCATIVSVQTLQKYFGNVKFTTELLKTANMRFVNFDVQNEFSESLSIIEKTENMKGSSMPFMFRSQFTEGSVYNSSMLGNLLYQGFLKDYLIPVIRRLLGLVQTPNSGFLTSVSVAKNMTWASTYGMFFTYLSVTTGDVPVAIFRTQRDAFQRASPSSAHEHVIVESPLLNSNLQTGGSGVVERAMADEINSFVKGHLTRLGLSADDYEYECEDHKVVSYVIINPDHSLPLEEEDVVIVIRPSQARTVRSKAWSLKIN